VLLVLTLCWAPWVRLLCDRLPDRGATIVRPLALLATVFPAWLLASLGVTPYSTALIWATLALGGLCGWAVLWHRRLIDRSWLWSLVIAESLALAAFAGYLWLRGFTPEILHTEKPMDAAFLMSSTLTTTIPPPDPWFAGEPINYYYLGYLLQGTLARLFGVPGTTGFNLALATTFSAALTAAAGLGWNIARRWASRRLALVAAGLTATLLILAGNLYAAAQFWQTPVETLAASWWDKEFGVGWRASRIVCDTERISNDCASAFETINEFPAFSFILGDLHPHVLALPFTITALALTLALTYRVEPTSTLSSGDWIRIGLTGATIGSLYALNSWDFPTYLLICALALWWTTGYDWKPVGLLIAAAIVPWLPFYLNFIPPTASVGAYLPEAIRDVPLLPRLFGILGLHTGDRTSIAEFLTIFGLPYALCFGLIATWWAESRPLAPNEPRARWLAVVVAGVVIISIVAAAPLVALCGVPLLLLLVLIRNQPTLGLRTISAALFAVGLALILGTEFVFIQDVFHSRMNTLFKFYYQVWTLFSVASGTAVVAIWSGTRVPARAALAIVTSVGLLAGLVYPVLSTRAWTDEFQDWAGLDGIEYVAQHSADEVAAIRWLQANAKLDDVVLEAAGCSYQINGGIPFNRASAFTGVPTVIGWRGHEEQWRLGSSQMSDEIPIRQEDVAAIFADPASPLLDSYGVTLLYLGIYERDDWQHVCPSAGPYPGLDQPGYPGPGWEPVFTQGEVSIYRRVSPD
jgi:YYY domain-containing protein